MRLGAQRLTHEWTSENAARRGFYEIRKSLAAGGVVVVFAVGSPTPLTAQGFLGHDVDEPRDEPQPREDVDHREELAERGGRSEIPKPTVVNVVTLK